MTCGLGSVWSLSSAWSLGYVPVGFNCRLMCEGGSVRGSRLMCGFGLVIRVNSSPVHFILLLHFFEIDTPHLSQEVLRCPHLTNTAAASVLIDRLVHPVHLFVIHGSSYRLKDKLKKGGECSVHKRAQRRKKKPITFLESGERRF